MKTTTACLVLLFTIPLCLFSQIPQYYNEVDFSLSPQQVKQQLTDLVTTTHQYELSYTPEVWEALKVSDLIYENGTEVLLVYGYDDLDGISKTDRSRDLNLNCTTSSCVGFWNREHVFPRSLGNPTLETSYPNAGTDAHGIRACDSQMNSSRGNRVFETGAGNAEITPNGNFYPGDEWKGDVARIIMYLYLRYPTQCEAVSVGYGASSYAALADMPDIFLEWNAEDPVSTFEIYRNEVIWANQGNRNPFIDNPHLATVIWNGPQAEDVWGVLSTQNTHTLTYTCLYPTVTDGVIYIESEIQGSFNYRVYTVSGHFVTGGEAVKEINLDTLSKGMYFIQLQSRNFSQTEKIIMD